MMKSGWIAGSLFTLISLITLSGCVPKNQYDKCVRHNEEANRRIEELLAQQQNWNLEMEKYKQECDLLRELQTADKNKIKALEASLEAKKALIDQLSSQVGRTALPLELSNALSDWAQKVGSDMVTYDEKNGVVRFKSDLLFAKGEDTVQPEARLQLEAFSAIMNSAVASGFDVLIVGHTDDIPILKPDTLVKHPTNWHLSAHRAISVENILASSGIKPTRLAIMGMGEFRPVEPNAANNRGNPLNRRVEIYIVPAGQIHISSSAASSS